MQQQLHKLNVFNCRLQERLVEYNTTKSNHTIQSAHIQDHTPIHSHHLHDQQLASHGINNPSNYVEYSAASELQQQQVHPAVGSNAETLLPSNIGLQPQVPIPYVEQQHEDQNTPSVIHREYRSVTSSLSSHFNTAVTITET
eukprot:3565404-Ditylum_brightwellii.AAC.1